MDCWHRQFQLVFLLSSRHSSTTVTLTTALRCRCYMRFLFTCLQSIALKAQRRTLLSTARLKAREAGLVLLLFNTAKASGAAHHVCCQLQARSSGKVTAPDPDPDSFCDEISCRRRRRAQGPSQLPEEGEHATLRNTRCGRATPPSPLPRPLRKKKS